MLVGPRASFADGDPFLAGGGAVDLVGLDEVVWSDPPDREEAGSPNVVGAVALETAIERTHRNRVGSHLGPRARAVLVASARDWRRSTGSGFSVPTSTPTRWPSPPSSSKASTTPSVAARLSAEWAIGVRHGCFCAHPYLIRLLGLSPEAVDAYRRQVRHKDHRAVPGAVRASCSISTTIDDVDALLAAVSELAGSPSRRSPIEYAQDIETGDYWPVTEEPAWASLDRRRGAWCSRG